MPRRLGKSLDQNSGTAGDTPTGSRAAAPAGLQKRVPLNLSAREAAAGGGLAPVDRAESNRRLKVFPLGGVSGLESKCRSRTCDRTIHSRMLLPTELISRLEFERAIRYTPCDLPASARQPGIHRTRTIECFSLKHGCDGRAVKTGHPGRNRTASLRFVRAALFSLSYRAIVW